MDIIRIRDLEVECIVGVLPEEREKHRSVVLNLCLECDLRAAGQSDRLPDTVDYREVRARVVETVQRSSVELIERLAQRVADAVLSVKGVHRVTVLLDKPGALESSRSVAVEINRP